MASSLSRKLNSFSGKNPYDDVFGGPKKVGAPSFSSVEDYKEIFGSSKGSSIPVLDLSGLDEPNEYRSSKPDYSNIFAGFGDEQVGVSYQELFVTSKLAKTSSHKLRTPSATGSPLPRSDNLNCSEQNQVISSKSPHQSSDAVKQFNMSYHKTDQKGKDGTKGTTHVAELHAVPGFTCFIDEMTPPQKTGDDKPKSIPVKKENDMTHISPKSDVHHKMDSNDTKLTSGAAVKSRSGSSWDGTYSKDEFSNAFEMTPPQMTGNDMPKPKPIPINKENDRTKPSPISDVRHKMDSNDTKQTSGRAVKSRSKSSLDGTYSKDEFLNAFEINLESPPSKANLVNSKGRLKRSTTSNFEAPKVDAGDCSSPSSDEELDVNSAAAASIAALRKAIEKAQESIRIAKESMERKKEKGGLQSCSNFSSQYSLKVKDRKENFIAPEENITQKKNARQTGERADAAYQDFTDRHEGLFKEIKTAKETLEQQTRVIEKSESVREAYDLEDMDIYENAVDMAHDQEKNVDELTDYIVHKHEENEKSGIAQPDEEIREEQKGLYEHESCEEIFEDSQETIEDENEFESQDLREIDNEKRLNGTLEVVENENIKQEVPEKEHIEKKIKDAEENEKIPKTFHNEEVTEKRLAEEVIQWVENGSKEVCGCESNEKKQEYAHRGDITETRLDEVSLLEENEKRRTDAHGEKECENKIKEKYECELKEKSYDGAYTYEGENIQSENGESEGIEKIEVYDKNSIEAHDGKDIEKKVEEECESEQNEMSYTGAYTYEGENRQRENDESEEIEKIEVDEKRSTDAHDGKETEKKIEEDCDWGGNDKRVTGTDIYEEAEYFQRNGIEESETIEAPEEALYENRINRSGDACSHGASNSTSETEETSISVSGDASESLPSDDNGANFGSTEMDIVDKKVEQNNEDSEFSSNLANGIEILANESRGNEKIDQKDKIVLDEEEETNTPEPCHEERQWAENGAELEAFQVPSVSEEKEKIIEIDGEIKTRQDTENIEKNTKETVSKEVEEKEDPRKIDEAIKREREKDRLVVERAIREARERAFAEARERAERAAVERATAEVRQRVMAEAREKHEKASAGLKSPAEKASVEAKIRAERAAVERATAEARERALEKVLSQKSTSVSEKFSGTSKDSAMNQSFSSSDSQRFDGTITESAQRCKEKSESHQRIMQRAAKALAEKNMRDLLAQKEQAERDRLAKTLDADIKRWSNGKEGNLRALLSTLQYILGPSSGWQPVSLTDIIDTNAVKKAYRKATLYVHPDKLQQRGANIQQKYICEKVFDLLKAAWNKFNSEER